MKWVFTKRAAALQIFIFLNSIISAKYVLAYEWDSRFELRHFYYPLAKSDPQVSDLENETHFEVGALRLQTQLNWSPKNPSPEERFYFDFSQANYRWNFDPWSLKVGSDIFNWGVTDGFNPVDIVNTKNYFDPIHSKKMGALNVQLNFSKEGWEFDFILIPKANKALLPGTNSRWLPREIYISNQPTVEGNKMILRLPQTLNYTYDRPSTNDTEDSPLKNNIAFRGQKFIENTEFGIYYYDGVAGLPLISPIVTGQLIQISPEYIVQVDSDVILQIQEYRQKMLGLSMTHNFQSFLFKIESAGFQSQDSVLNLKPIRYETVVALEKPISPQWITIIQYAWTNTNPTFSGNDLDSLTHFFESNTMLGVQYLGSQNQSGTLFISHDLKLKSSLMDLTWIYRMNDLYKIKTYIHWIEANTNSSLGAFSNNKKFGLGIEANF